MPTPPPTSVLCIDPAQGDWPSYKKLEGKTFTLDLISTGAYCLEEIEINGEPDVIVYTARGDGNKGLHFLAQILEKHPKLPTLLHTLHTKQTGIKEAIQQGKLGNVVELTADKMPLANAITAIVGKPRQNPNGSTEEVDSQPTAFPPSLFPQFCRALQLIGDAVFVLDTQGNIIHTNPLACSIMGATDEELNSTPFQNYLPKDVRIQERWQNEYIAAVKCKSLETKVLHLGNTFRRARLTVWPVEDSATGLREIIVLARDRTRNQLLVERQEFLEEALYPAQQFEVSITMAGGLAHQFNNMLTPVFGLSELLCERDDLPEDVMPLLQEIRTGAERAADLVQSMLLSTRQANQATQNVDMEKAMQTAIRILSAKMPPNIHIRHDIRGPLPEIKGDTEHMQLLLLNVGTNAMEAMEETGGTISIRACFRKNTSFPIQRQKDYNGPAILIEISDNGPGIPDDFLPSIFQPFQSSDNINRAGMGLAVVRGIIEKHNGFIDAYSTVGKGTSFYIFLPVDPEAAKNFEDTFDPIQYQSERIRKLSSQAPIDRTTALLIDDHEHVLLAITRMLESMKIEVDAFDDPLEGTHAFQKDPDKYNVILTDLKMPGMSGIDFAHGIRRIAPRIPIILLTGYNDIREALNEMPFDKLLAKPIIPSKLKEVLQQLIGERLEALSAPPGEIEEDGKI